MPVRKTSPVGTRAAAGAAARRGRKPVAATEPVADAAQEQNDAAVAPARPAGKREAVLALVSAPEGATLAALMAETGWQAHSVRGLLSGLRKAGHGLLRIGTGAEARYRIERAG